MCSLFEGFSNTGPIERDLPQIPFITKRSLDRDVMQKAAELLLDRSNVSVVDVGIHEHYVINSERNLAQTGLRNQITVATAKEFLRVQMGISKKVPRSGHYENSETLDAMEVTSLVV